MRVKLKKNKTIKLLLNCEIKNKKTLIKRSRKQIKNQNNKDRNEK